MVRASNLPSPAPISKKSLWTAVQVTVSKTLMLRSKNQLSIFAGKFAGKVAQKRLNVRIRFMGVSSMKTV